MGKIFLFYCCFSSFVISAHLLEETSDVCDREDTFQLSLFGRKQEDGHWNTTYDLKRSSCVSKKNWDLVMAQNITHDGNSQKLHLRGYFMDNIHSSGMGSLKSPALDRLQIITPDNSTLTDGQVCKGLNSTGGFKLKIVSRSEWKAKRRSRALLAVDHPASRLHFYQKDVNCSTTGECVLAIQKMQEKEIPMRGDIFANFISAPDGRIYEGIGWDRSMDNELNFKYLTVGSNPPPPQQMASVALLIRQGVEAGKISTSHRFSGNLAEMTKKWIAWVNNL